MRGTGAGARAQARPLRVALVSPRYSPYVGGVESHVETVAQRLAAAGLEVTVLTTDPSRSLPRLARDGDVEIMRVPAWPKGRDYHVAPGVAAVLRKRQWDVVHVQSYHTAVAPIAMATAKRVGIPYVVTFHGGGHSARLRARARGGQLRLLGPLLRRADRVIAVARFEIELYGRLLGIAREKFVLIPNGGDLPNGVTPAEGRDEGLIASVGRLERYKGHQRAIEALPHVIDRLPGARLWIAGAGPYEGELRRLAAALGVARRVEIRAIPTSERAAFARKLASASLCVLLSEFETHPLAIIEAVALGLPAVVTDTSGLAELAERGFARAVPLDSTPQEIAEAMVREIQHPPVRRELELPTWDECVAALESLYREVVRSRV